MVDSGTDFGSRFDRLYSAGTGQAASIRATAKALGVSRDTVRRMREGHPSPRGEAALHRAERREARRPQWLNSGPDVGRISQIIPLTGTGPAERDVRGQLEMVAIRRADGSIDRAATGQAFGVSTSTIGRWLRGEARPTMAHQGDLRTEVRSRLLTDSADAMDQAFTGANIFLRFDVIISDDERSRAISRHLDGQAMRAAHAAWLAGGDAGLADFFRSDIEDNYFGGGGVPDAEVRKISEATLSTRLY